VRRRAGDRSVDGEATWLSLWGLIDVLYESLLYHIGRDGLLLVPNIL